MSEVNQGCQPSDCASCAQNCPSKEEQDPKAGHPLAHVDKVIGVVSGKGGVGKSLVTAALAVLMRQEGKSVGIIDADITGPSVPKMFGVTQKAFANDDGIIPVESAGGIDLMSMNLLLPEDTDPVVWRGPIIGSAVKQFWTDVQWGDKDFLFVDMPPGTGDVALNVFQSMPVDGIIIVTTPQDLVSMIVQKAIKMANEMHVPILGVVENMSYLSCPDCGKKISVFGESHLDEICSQYGLKALAKIPIDPAIASLVDQGKVEEIKADWLSDAKDVLGNL